MVTAGRMGVILRGVPAVVGVLFLLLLVLFAQVVAVGQRRRVVLAVRVVAAVGLGLDWVEGNVWVRVVDLSQEKPNNMQTMDVRQQALEF